jgi:hypothetical protein
MLAVVALVALLRVPGHSIYLAPYAVKYAPLDFQFFVSRVEPIFLKERTGGARCYNCHSLESNKALFRLQPLQSTGVWDEQQSRQNFRSVLKLVNLDDPLKSRILLHPLAPEAGGDEFHSGGKFWMSKNDSEWQTIAEWIRGSSSALDYAYFKDRVQPILNKQYKGSHHYSCMSCHAEGSSRAGDFRLAPPDSEHAIRRNYGTTLRFAHAGDPNGSPVLTKPYKSTGHDSQRSVRGDTHSGGKFWRGETDPDFQVIYEWIRGAR